MSEYKHLRLHIRFSFPYFQANRCGHVVRNGLDLYSLTQGFGSFSPARGEHYAPPGDWF